jgi:hypothetical protein
VWASTANSVRDDGLVRLLRFAGRPCALPFRGDTSGPIFEAILNRAPPVRLNPSLLADLEHIINKALEKDRDVRYQHAADLRAVLKRLKRDTDSGRAGSGRATFASTTGIANAAAQQSGSSAASALAHERTGKLIVATVIVALLIAAAGYGVYSLMRGQATANR